MTEGSNLDIGVYVGPADYDEVVEAIAAHGAIPGAELVAGLIAEDGQIVWQKHGFMTEHVTGSICGEADAGDPPRSNVFVIGGRQARSLGTVLMYTDVPLVLDLERGDWIGAGRYSEGVRIHLAVGGTLTILFWRGILHVTEHGDVVPGPGGFRQ